MDATRSHRLRMADQTREGGLWLFEAGNPPRPMTIKGATSRSGGTRGESRATPQG